MQAGALRPYEESLRTGRPLHLCREDGRTTMLDVERWLAPADAADETVLARCSSPVLDIGCGPGRLVAALLERDCMAAGVDIASAAVTLARSRGLSVLHRDVFAPLPGEGLWRTALLIDGNIGIGGDPARLLARVANLLVPGGTALIETHHEPSADESLQVRFTRTGAPIGPLFPWAHVGRHALRTYAARLGYTVHDSWTVGERSFVALSTVRV